MDATNGRGGMMEHVQPDRRGDEATDREGTLGLSSV